MSKNRPITKWSVLALIVVVVGGAITLLLGQLWLGQWAKTGQRLAVGSEQSVELPAGNVLVYYESSVAVPEIRTAKLSVLDPYGRRLRPIIPAEDHTFKLMFGGSSGRALWELEIVEPGVHTIRCFNNNFASDADVPAEDRVVFGKQPGSVAQAIAVRKTILITGAVITIALAVILYILHGLALRKRAAAPAEAAAAGI